jgi:hypothetical protein
MSSDALHGVISRKIKQEKYIYSVLHFINQVENYRKNIYVKELTHENILIFNNNCKQNVSKLFPISEVRQIQIRKNCYEINIKLDDDNHFSSFDILNANFKELLNNFQSILESLPKQSMPREITQHKFNTIKKLTENLNIEVVYIWGFWDSTNSYFSYPSKTINKNTKNEVFHIV